MTTSPAPLSADDGSVLLAEVIRDPVVESRHRGHAVVVDTTGRIVFAVGDPERATLPRSAIKPLQALPTLALGAVERFGLEPREVAVMCASHRAEGIHLAAVRSILGKIGAGEEHLHCGPHPVPDPDTAKALLLEGREPTSIHNNCSGKHSGMLALARLLDAPLETYWQPDHPAQRAIQRALALTADVDTGALTWGTDGCGVPTYLMSLRQLALGFARLAAPEALPLQEQHAAHLIGEAVNAHPEYVSGTGMFHAQLLHATGGALVAKGGAEGCYGIGVRGRGLGIAVKMEDGDARAVPPVLYAILSQLDVLSPAAADSLAEWREPIVRNTRGDVVGSIRATLA